MAIVEKRQRLGFFQTCIAQADFCFGYYNGSSPFEINTALKKTRDKDQGSRSANFSSLGEVQTSKIKLKRLQTSLNWLREKKLGWKKEKKNAQKNESLQHGVFPSGHPAKY